MAKRALAARLTKVRRSGIALATLSLIIVCGLLPHLNVEGHRKHQYTLFNTEDIANDATTTIWMVGARLPDDIDVYRLYSVSAHIHLCLFAWIVTTAYVSGVQTPRWYKYLVVIVCMTGLVTSLLFLFLADMFSTEAISHMPKGSFLDKQAIKKTHKFLGQRTFAGHLFQYLCFFVALSCYLLERKKR